MRRGVIVKSKSWYCQVGHNVCSVYFTGFTGEIIKLPSKCRLPFAACHLILNQSLRLQIGIQYGIYSILIAATSIFALWQPRYFCLSVCHSNNHISCDISLTIQVCQKLNQERPGGLLVAVPGNMPGECLVLCLKVSFLVPTK